jgi:tetratricopeptide (TPR) repeat protein
VRADRLLFLPSLGFALVLAWGILELGRRSRTLALALLAVFLVGYSGRSIARNPDWDSNYTLFQADLKKNPGSAIGWALYGDALRDRGEPAEAEAAYGRAIRLRDAISFYPEVHNNLAQVLAARGDLAGAEREYRLVLSREPQQFTALVNLAGMLLSNPVARSEAIALLERAISIDPEDPAPRINLTQAYDLAGDYDRALATLDEAIRGHPERADLWDIRAIVLRKAGREAEARDADARAAALR